MGGSEGEGRGGGGGVTPLLVNYNPTILGAEGAEKLSRSKNGPRNTQNSGAEVEDEGGGGGVLDMGGGGMRAWSGGA